MRNLEQLQQFAEFLDFLAHPEEHKKLLASIIEATAEYNKAAGDLKKGKDFQTWSNEQMNLLNRKEKSVQESMKLLEQEAKKNADFLTAESAKLDKRNAVVAMKEANVDAVLKELSYVEQEKAALEKMRVALGKRQEDLARKEAEFEEKAKALAALMKV